jgi:hypothetical protein
MSIQFYEIQYGGQAMDNFQFVNPLVVQPQYGQNLMFWMLHTTCFHVIISAEDIYILRQKNRGQDKDAVNGFNGKTSGTGVH